jgi:hypothetical protein
MAKTPGRVLWQALNFVALVFCRLSATRGSTPAHIRRLRLAPLALSQVICEYMHDLGTTHSANPRPVDNIALCDYMAPPIMDGLDGIECLATIKRTLKFPQSAD